MYLLFPFPYLCIACYIPPIIPFPTSNNMSRSVCNFNFTPVFFKHPCHANHGANKKWPGSS